MKTSILILIVLATMITEASSCFKAYQIAATKQSHLPASIKMELTEQKQALDRYLKGHSSPNEIYEYSFLALGRLKKLLSNHIYRDFSLFDFHKVDIPARNKELELISAEILKSYKETFIQYSLDQNLNHKEHWQSASISQKILSYTPYYKHSDLAYSRRYLEIFDPHHKSGLGSDRYESAKYWIHVLLNEGPQRAIIEVKKNFDLEVSAIR